MDRQAQAGIVYLIGAGPGDPGLITVAGLEILRNADAIVYDALIPHALLAEVRPGAELHDVGKRAGSHTIAQDHINALLVRLGRSGKKVARLKGGDPFVFGRGGEEMHALYAAGISCKVIPGVSSAVAVPALAGIPVTHRGLSASFAVITAQRATGAPEPDWATLAHLDTLIILMGRANLEESAARLIEAGRAPHTPVACIQSGTTMNQRVITGTLATIADLAEQSRLGTPMITVIGAVAAFPALVQAYTLESEH